MPLVSKTFRMLEKMFARNISYPVDDLMELYRQTLPPASRFDKQAEALRKSFEESQRLLRFADLVAKVYPNGEEFSVKMKQGQENQARNAMLVEMRAMGGVAKKACDVYLAALTDIKYQPYRLEEFEETTPDFSAVRLKKMAEIHDVETQRKDQRASSSISLTSRPSR